MQTIWVKNNQKFGTMVIQIIDEFGTHHFSLIFQENLSFYSSTKNSHWLDTHLKEWIISLSIEMEQVTKFIGSADVTIRALFIQYVFQPC